LLTGHRLSAAFAWAGLAGVLRVGLLGDRLPDEWIFVSIMES